MRTETSTKMGLATLVVIAALALALIFHASDIIKLSASESAAPVLSADPLVAAEEGGAMVINTMENKIILNKAMSKSNNLVEPGLSSDDAYMNKPLDRQAETSVESALEGLANRQLAQINLHTEAELSNLFDRAERFYENRPHALDEPIKLVLHGDEVRFFQSDNYKTYSSLVDRAAKLNALRVIDIQVCETWMRFNDVSKGELPAFVGTVPNGPNENAHLKNEGYRDF